MIVTKENPQMKTQTMENNKIPLQGLGKMTILKIQIMMDLKVIK